MADYIDPSLAAVRAAMADLDALIAAPGTPGALKLRAQYWRALLARSQHANLLATLRADIANGSLTVAQRIEALDRAGWVLLSEVL